MPGLNDYTPSATGPITSGREQWDDMMDDMMERWQQRQQQQQGGPNRRGGADGETNPDLRNISKDPSQQYTQGAGGYQSKDLRFQQTGGGARGFDPRQQYNYMGGFSQDPQKTAGVEARRSAGRMGTAGAGYARQEGDQTGKRPGRNRYRAISNNYIRYYQNEIEAGKTHEEAKELAAKKIGGMISKDSSLLDELLQTDPRTLRKHNFPNFRTQITRGTNRLTPEVQESQNKAIEAYEQGEQFRNIFGGDPFLSEGPAGWKKSEAFPPALQREWKKYFDAKRERQELETGTFRPPPDRQAEAELATLRARASAPHRFSDIEPWGGGTTPGAHGPAWEMPRSQKIEDLKDLWRRIKGEGQQNVGTKQKGKKGQQDPRVGGLRRMPGEKGVRPSLYNSYKNVPSLGLQKLIDAKLADGEDIPPELQRAMVDSLNREAQQDLVTDLKGADNDALIEALQYYGDRNQPKP